jgi:sugar phosphate isomerase/epimerase
VAGWAKPATTRHLARDVLRLPSPNSCLTSTPVILCGYDGLYPTIYEFKDRIFHFHFKDIKLYPENLNDVGVMAYPMVYMSPKLPGLGDVDWGKFVSALTDIDFDGYACIEVEDRAFEGSRDKVLDSLRLSYRYMRQFVI